VTAASQVEAVWRARAKRLSERPVSAETRHNAVPVLILAMSKERYAVDLPDVIEVLAPVRPTPVPGTAAVFAGVINVHGEIRPVLDLRRLLGMPAPGLEMGGSGPLARVILLRRNGRELGLQIDGVEQIRWIGPGELERAGTGAMASSPYIKGTTRDLLMLLSTAALFAELHISELNQTELNQSQLNPAGRNPADLHTGGPHTGVTN
jgi:purine-binding chemotaxis protein CheW